MPRRETSLRDIIAGSRSKSFRSLNAGLYAASAPGMGEVSHPIPESPAIDAAAGQACRQGRGKARVGGRDRKRAGDGARTPDRKGPSVRVHFCSYRKPGAPLDRDNLIGGCKHLRDQVARWLGLDDSERCIDWEYSQCETRGALGTGVRIEVLC